jgi:hypothetical protein
MLLAASEGRHWRYEICEHADGYLVQMRDLQTGDLDDDFATVFRTLPVAFAYAEMSAALERYAAAEMEDKDALTNSRWGKDIAVHLEASERSFISLSGRLHDDGVDGGAIKAWERARDRPARPRYH